MKRPNPPFLELGFYFANIPEADAFARLITTLLSLGATFTGEASMHRGIGIREKPFASITDAPLPELVTLDAATLMRSLVDPDIRLIEVYLDGAIGVARNAAEIVSYVSVSPEAAHADRHPLAILTEAEIFSGSLRQRFARRARRAGRQVYQRLRALVEATRPAYAAITVEFPLQCPTDLRRDPRSLAFRDFFVSGTYIGAPNLAVAKNLFAGAFVEPLTDGLYISCTKDFNPDGRNLPVEDAQRRSVEQAKLIASLHGGLQHEGV
jgi:hypothetical protein